MEAPTAYPPPARRTHDEDDEATISEPLRSVVRSHNWDNVRYQDRPREELLSLGFDERLRELGSSDELRAVARWCVGTSTRDSLGSRRRFEALELTLDESDRRGGPGLVRDQGLVHRAARAGDLAALGLLLQRGLAADDLDPTCARGGAALLEATQRLEIAAVDLLLRRGADPNKVGSSQRTLWAPPDFPDRAVRADASALEIAARFGAVDIAELLLRSGAAVEGPERARGTPLGAAVDGDSAEMVALLLRWGAGVSPSTVARAARVASVGVLRPLLARVEEDPVDSRYVGPVDGYLIEVAEDIARHDAPGSAVARVDSAREYAVLDEILSKSTVSSRLKNRLLGGLRWNCSDARGAGYAFLLRKYGARCFHKEKPGCWRLFAPGKCAADRFYGTWVSRVAMRKLRGNGDARKTILGFLRNGGALW